MTPPNDNLPPEPLNVQVAARDEQGKAWSVRIYMGPVFHVATLSNALSYDPERLAHLFVGSRRLLDVAKALLEWYAALQGGDIGDASLGEVIDAAETAIATAEPGVPEPLDANESFEIEAEKFHKETGLIAPGKSVPADMASEDYDSLRRRAWDTWRQAKGATR